MAVSGVNGASTSTSTTAGTTKGQADPAAMGRDQFLKMLVAQMQHQDPLNPTSQGDITAQLTQLSQLDSMQQLNSNFSQFLLLQGLGQGSNLLGKTVEFGTGDSTTEKGVVSSVSVADGKVQLMVNNKTVSLADIKSILTSAS